MNVCSPDKVKEILDSRAGEFSAVVIGSGMCGAILAALEGALMVAGEKLSKEERRERRCIVLGWIWNNNQPLSSKILTQGQWHALRRWADVDNHGGKWMALRPSFAAEARMILTRATFDLSGGVLADRRKIEIETEKDALVYDAARNLGGIVTVMNDGSDDLPGSKAAPAEHPDNNLTAAGNKSSVYLGDELW